MSVLDTPRITFRGRMAWDPIVTNNYARNYSEPASEPTIGGGTAADYRARSIATMVADGNWNIDGTHKSLMYDAEVTGVDLGDGLTVDDPVVGVPVSLLAMLVDAEPYGSTSSQLFYDSFSVGIDGGYQVALAGAEPFAARRINFSRNSGYQVIAGVASVAWQATVTDGVAISAFDSPALARLQEAIDDGRADGITVRFYAYRTEYFGVEAPGSLEWNALHHRLTEGGFQHNPARSLVVGSVGLWREGEPMAEPGDRTLVPVGGTTVAAAFAKATRSRLTIDLGNSIPEIDFEVTKTNLGPLEVQATAPGGDTVSLGTLELADYDREAYDRTSGIVTLDLDPAQAEAAATGDLAILAEGQRVLAEQDLMAYPTSPNLYLDEQDPLAPSTPPSLGVHVLRRGRRVTEPVSVLVVRPGSTNGPTVAVTDDDGTVTLPVDDGAGAWVWLFVPFDGDTPPSPPPMLDTQAVGYATTRVLPLDEYLDALPPTWENVYTNVLISWKALAPCMDNWLDLEDEEACRNLAPLMKRLSASDNHDRFRYMPVTRDLTRGQRALLHRWCDAATGLAPAVAMATASPAPAAAGLPPEGSPSRSSRGM